MKHRIHHIFKADRQQELFKKTTEDLLRELAEQKKKQENYPVGYLNRANTDGKIWALEYAVKILEWNNCFITEHYM